VIHCPAFSPHSRADPGFPLERGSVDLSACKWLRALATMKNEGLADAGAASPFRLPRNRFRQPRGYGDIGATRTQPVRGDDPFATDSQTACYSPWLNQGEGKW
jgi:hypothetical protein